MSQKGGAKEALAEVSKNFVCWRRQFRHWCGDLGQNFEREPEPGRTFAFYVFCSRGAGLVTANTSHSAAVRRVATTLSLRLLYLLSRFA